MEINATDPVAIATGVRIRARQSDTSNDRNTDQLNADFQSYQPVINYLSMRDQFQLFRDQWFAEAFELSYRYDFSLNVTSAISRSHHSFDAIALGGDDIMRLVRFLKDNAPGLHSCVKIAVMAHSSPAKRAKAIRAGYDDVFDIFRCSKEEAAARLFVIRKRYEMAAERNAQQTSKDKTLLKVCDVFKISSRERKVLEFLIEKKSCTYYQLQVEISDFVQEMSFENLKVVISNLRKKLKPGAAIVARRGMGYELIFPA